MAFGHITKTPLPLVLELDLDDLAHWMPKALAFQEELNRAAKE